MNNLAERNAGGWFASLYAIVLILIGVGLFAVSIREFAIAAPASILIAAWAQSRANERAWLLLITCILAVGLAWILIAASMTQCFSPRSCFVQLGGWRT